MRELNDWFSQSQRDFPWRQDRTPYKVWISEVMLQQTRASVVVSYFERWMSLFPDVSSVANAPLETIIKAWEGLGYYSRARNIWRAAKQIVAEFDGVIPNEKRDLEKIYGLGPYTTNAILSFGFKKRAAAVDANVTRVIARFFAVEENVCTRRVKEKIQKGAEALLDSEEPWVTSEALIELGATLCTKKPQCGVCPLRNNCLGQKIASTLPIKNAKEKTIHLNRAVLLLENQGQILVRKGEKGKVMADLYEFPFLEMGNEVWSERKILKKISEKFGKSVSIIKKMETTAHTFTKYKAKLFPFKLQTDDRSEVAGYLWISKEELPKLPFSSGHRRLL